jgi:Transmembrane amino acid transporter protein
MCNNLNNTVIVQPTHLIYKVKASSKTIATEKDMAVVTSTGTTTNIPSYRSIQIEPNYDTDDDGNTYSMEDDSLQQHSTHYRSNRYPNSNDHQSPQHEQPPPQSLSVLAACLALMKGNLGPGILNLPHAFSKVQSIYIGSILFCIVTIQGLYSMTLLVYCKNLMNQYNSNHHRQPILVQTFMDVTKTALGDIGGRITEIFVFVLQLGVCCVFVSLIATNIQAIVTFITPFLSISIITICMMIAVTIFRFIHDLFWFNAIANTFMLIAILTATIASIIHILHNNSIDDNTASSVSWSSTTTGTENTTTSTTSISAAITFTADMFFAFEGIGLVLPVENNYNTNIVKQLDSTTSATTTTTVAAIATITSLSSTTTTSHKQHNKIHGRWKFYNVLLFSMGCVAILFAITGLSASIGFHHTVTNASITAFLKESYPNVLWYSIVNILVLFAVALTFPLQLTPAMEVLEKWLLEFSSRTHNHRFYTINRTDSDDEFIMSDNNTPTQDALYTPQNVDIDHPNNLQLPITTSLTVSVWNQYGWMIRRWIVVLTCSTIVLIVNNDLGLLVSLFGAVGQTGLAAMPCAVHLVLQQRHIAPYNIFLTLVDILVILFCAIVMVAGCYLSLYDIIHKKV